MLTAAMVSAARQRMDIEIVGACRRAGMLSAMEEMVASSLTVQQVETELARRQARQVQQPAAAPDLAALAQAFRQRGR